MFGSVSKVWNQFHSEIFKGVEQTLLISFLSLLLGITIGFIIGFLRHIHISRKDNLASKIGKRGMKLTLDIYIAIFRYTPFITQAFFFYYVFFVSSTNMLLIGTCVLSFNVAAFMAVIMEGGIKSVDPGQYQAGRSLGLSHFKTFVVVILPQAFKNMIPAMSNEVINTIKATSVLSVIGITDLMFKIGQANHTTYDYAAGFTIAFLIYFVICLIFVLALKLIGKIIERRN